MYNINNDSRIFLFYVFLATLVMGLCLGFFSQLITPLNIIVAIVISPIFVYTILSKTDIQLTVLSTILLGFSLGQFITNIPMGYFYGNIIFPSNNTLAVLFVLALPTAFIVGGCIGYLIYFLINFFQKKKRIS